MRCDVIKSVSVIILAGVFTENGYKTAMTEQYRLINGEELYDIINDPLQAEDIAGPIR